MIISSTLLSSELPRQCPISWITFSSALQCRIDPRVHWLYDTHTPNSTSIASHLIFYFLLFNYNHFKSDYMVWYQIILYYIKPNQIKSNQEWYQWRSSSTSYLAILTQFNYLSNLKNISNSSPSSFSSRNKRSERTARCEPRIHHSCTGESSNHVRAILTCNNFIYVWFDRDNHNLWAAQLFLFFSTPF